MRIYKTVDISVPNDLNLTELLHSSARSPLPSNHLIANDCLTGRSLTIEQLRDRAGRLASGLTDRYAPVDQSRWAVVLPNSVNYVEIFHAVLWLGGVACPINHALKPGEIGHALIVSKPHFILAYGPVLQAVLDGIEIAKATAKKEKFEFAVPHVVTVLASGPTDYPDIEQFLAEKRLAVPHYADTKQRLASIHLSSGTTGNPKGVALSHFNYIANVLQLFQHDPSQWTSEVRMVSYTPFVHIANTTIPLFLGPWTGMRHSILPAYTLESFAKMVHDNKATAVQAVGPVATALLTTGITQRYDFSSVRKTSWTRGTGKQSCSTA
jgi:acyl-CoA synthetase (AMP-forming)/AMP-acid ligase II